MVKKKAQARRLCFKELFLLIPLPAEPARK